MTSQTMTIQKTASFFKKIFRKCLAPIPKISVSEWADKHRIISQGNAFPGRWKTSRSPYQKEIMDSFAQAGVSRIVVMSCSQIGKSDIMNNAIGRFAHLDPCPIMMVQPTDATAEDYSKSRIAPMIRDTKILKKLFRDGKSRDSSNTILSKIFPGGRLIMTGSNSPSQLASRFIRILLCDEVDRFESSAGSEGDPIDLAEKRLTTFWNRLTALFSTPTIKGCSRIEAEYLMGTQEEWQHQCPNCKEFHLLTHREMEWKHEEYALPDNKDEKKLVVVHSVEWKCPDCGWLFGEETMKSQSQKYVMKNPEAAQNGVRSFFVNGFTPVWLSWKTIIKEYIAAQGDDDKLKVVFNTRFGESFEPKGVIENIQVFVDGREHYDADIPEDVLLLTCAVDTQDNRLEYEICGWGDGEEQWGIVKGVILGVPDQMKTWDSLDEIIDRNYYFKDGKSLRVARTFIDSGGHYTQDVYQYCKSNYHKNRIAIKGSSNYSAGLLDKIAKPKNYNIPLIMLGVSQGKQYIFERLQKSSADDPAGKLHFPSNDGLGYDKTYFEGLVSERLVKKKVNGRFTLVWENIATDGRNEPLDLKVYNLACIRSINPDWEKYKKERLVVKAETEPKKKRAPKSYGVVNRGMGGEY